MFKHLYSMLIWLVIIMKFLWFIFDIIYHYAKHKKVSKNILSSLKFIDDYMMNAVEMLMYIVLVIIFSPHRKHTEIKLTRDEQIIAFAIGVLGLLHTNWDYIRSYFLNVMNIKKDIQLIKLI